MISLRYHVATIVAVFLALAIGLLGGGAFVQPALQSELENQTQRLQRTTDSLREQVAQLNAETAAMEAFSDAALPYLTQDRLLGSRVIVVTQDGVEETVLAETQRALADAGADIVAVLTARSAIASEDPETQARLAEIIGRPTALGIDLPALTAGALAQRLASEPAGDAAEDVLALLLSEGFLTAGDEGADVDGVGGREQVVIVLGGGPVDEDGLRPTDFGVPLASRLLALGMDVAAGESTDTPATGSLVNELREGLGDAVVTVDDLDRSMGGAALVLGIDGLRTTGSGGAYGFRDGAEALPPLP